MSKTIQEKTWTERQGRNRAEVRQTITTETRKVGGKTYVDTTTETERTSITFR